MAVTRTKEEIRSALRALGYTGRSNELSKVEMIKWLADRGMPLHKVPRVGDIAAKLSGGGAGGSPMDYTRIQQMVSNAVHDALEGATVGASTGNIDMDAVRKMVAAEVMSAKPEKIVLDGDNAKPVKVEGRTHPMFEKVLKLVKAGLNVLLVGPAGCGKTTLAHQVATALKRDYGMLSCTAGASESQLIGWLLPIGAKAGTFEYVPSEFVRLYEKGNSVFLLDEFDAADPNMLLVINSALANGALHVPQRFNKPLVTRGKNASIIAAANTFGSGADTMYAGRNQLDAATLDRFYVVRMDYDTDLEAQLTGRVPTKFQPKWVEAPVATEADLKQLADWVDSLRAKVAAHKLRRVVSTRSFMKAMAARKARIPAQEIQQDLLAGWSRDELIKIGA